MTKYNRDIALTALSCMDFTSLKDAEPPHEIQEMVERAYTNHGPVAAVCVYARHLDQPYFSVPDQRIRVATVVNFPDGNGDGTKVADETAIAINKGADEIDLVLPYRDLDQAAAVVRACRDACPDAVLKVILETGELNEPSLIDRAAKIALDGGADFLKTSTGKTPVGATLEASEVMLSAIKSCGRPAGLKISGGVKTLTDAEPYIHQANGVLGKLSPDNFRIGASSLLTDVLVALRKNEGA